MTTFFQISALKCLSLQFLLRVGLATSPMWPSFSEKRLAAVLTLGFSGCLGTKFLLLKMFTGDFCHDEKSALKGIICVSGSEVHPQGTFTF